MFIPSILGQYSVWTDFKCRVSFWGRLGIWFQLQYPLHPSRLLIGASPGSLSRIHQYSRRYREGIDELRPIRVP